MNLDNFKSERVILSLTRCLFVLLFLIPFFHLLLDSKGHCLLEMPIDTGKTIALLSLVPFANAVYSPLKLLYCTHTVHKMEKTLVELCLLHDYELCHFVKHHTHIYPREDLGLGELLDAIMTDILLIGGEGQVEGAVTTAKFELI